ncbi:hypothetical protein BAE44_0026130, partial [Dichanthelium oligosanthes]
LVFQSLTSSLEDLALEDLAMIDCQVLATKFSSTTLKNLIITSRNLDVYGFDFDNDFEDLVIDAPNLISLHLEDLPFLAPCLLNVSSLVTASISLEEESFSSSDAKYSIVGALSNVTKLKLLSPVDNYYYYPSLLNKVLKRDLRRCQTFKNLKKLSIGDWCVDGDLHALFHLLRLSPTIQKLTLRLGSIGAWVNHRETDESEVEKVNCEHLKKVKITCVQGDKRVPNIVKIILTNAKSLLEIIIKPYERWY